MSNFNEVFIENSYDSDYSQEFRLKGSSQFRENDYDQAYNSFTKAIMVYILINFIMFFFIIIIIILLNNNKYIDIFV